MNLAAKSIAGDECRDGLRPMGYAIRVDKRYSRREYAVDAAGMAFVILVTTALCFPFFRTIYWMGDEGVLLLGAERMLEGSRLYRDFFEFLPPGGFVVTSAWFSLIGISFPAARALAIASVVVIASFTNMACRRASGSVPLSLMLPVGWVMMSQGLWTVVNHHYFATMFSMIAIWATLHSIEHRPRSSFVTGIAAAMAAMVTPTRGALVLLAAAASIMFMDKRGARLTMYFLGITAVISGFVFYLATSHSLVAAFDDFIVFPLRSYSSVQAVPFGWWAETRNLPLKYLFPVLAVLSILASAYEWRAISRDPLLVSCILFFGAAFLGCYPRPDIAHIAFAAPLVCPLFALCCGRLIYRWRPIFRYILAGCTIGLCAPAGMAFGKVASTALQQETALTPRGLVAFVGQPGATELITRIDAMPRNEAFFYYPYMPMMSFLSGRLQTSKYDIFVPYYTQPDQYKDACDSIMSHTRWAVLQRTSMEVWTIAFPAMKHVAPSELTAFESALDRGFDLKELVGGFELRQRNGEDELALCGGIAKSK